MRSPITVWRRMNSHSSSESALGLLRTVSGIAVLPTSCSSAASRMRLTSCSGSPRRSAVSPASRATPLTCSPSPPAFGDDLQQEVGALAPDRRPVGLVRVHALVGQPQGLLRRRRLGRDAGEAVRAADLEGVAGVAERLGGQQQQLVALAGRDRGEQAELVAAHPVDAAEALGRRLQALGQADEQRVAGRVAEAVVVLLEAVEVEEREQLRPLVAHDGHRVVEVGDERAAVAQAGEGVGERLHAAGGQQALVLLRRPAATARARAARR